MSFKPFVVPPRSQVGNISADLASEGQRVSDIKAAQVAILPAPTKPIIPDISEVKSVAHYFVKRPFQAYPAWLYHENGEQRLVGNEYEAAELGVRWREATIDERGRYGISHAWDYAEGTPWRALPWSGKAVFDPRNPGPGKEIVHAKPDPMATQAKLTEALISAVAANNPKPAAVDQKTWDEFMEFQAFKRLQDAKRHVDASSVQSETPAPAALEPLGSIASVLSETAEMEACAAEAKRLGLKLDGRWSLERVKQELAKAQEKAA